MVREHVMDIRVRYAETDAMGFLHHAVYPIYFEMGRTELFRSQGGNYRTLEERGLFFVVVELNCKYQLPARYDDLLTLRTTVKRVTFVKLEHEYQIHRGGEAIMSGRTVLACIDRDGKVQKLSNVLPVDE